MSAVLSPIHFENKVCARSDAAKFQKLLVNFFQTVTYFMVSVKYYQYAAVDV